MLSSPSVVDGVVHVGSQDGKLYAFDAAGATSCSGTPRTCAPLWTAATGGLIISSPAVAGGMVYVGSFDDKLHAFDADGVTNCGGTPKACTPLWTAAIETLDGVISSPSVANGLVFVGGGLGTDNLYAFDAAGVTNCSGTPKTCSPVWTGETGSGLRSSPALAGGRVYVGSDSGGLLAFSLPDARDGEYHPLVPSRILDTRQSVPLGENGRLTVPVAGRAGVPATRVSSVVLNVTATQPTAASHLAVFPSSQLAPATSSVNFAPNQTVANAVVVKLSTDGKVDIFNQQGSTHVVVDVQGWFGAAGAAPGARYNPLVPGRILDTRTTVALAPNSAAGLVVTGRNGVPAAGVSSVVLNLTATQPTADGHLTVWPTGSTRPLASNINFAPNQTVANAVVAKVGTDGMVSIYNAQGSTHVVVDVQGWFSADGSEVGARYTPVPPSRILDTRFGTPVPVGPNGTISLNVTGRAGVPETGVSTVVLNLTVTEPTAAGHLTVWPAGATRPLASNINFAPNQTVANAVVAKVGADGRVNIYNAQGSTHVVVDVQGWFEG